MANRPWTKTDVAKIERLAESGLSYPQLALEFPERSMKAIREFCRRHEIEVKVETEPTGQQPSIHPSRLPDYAGMTFTALLFGDPTPQRSALFQKTRAEERSR